MRSATKVTDEVLNVGKRLKLVGRAGTGIDNIDIKSATRNGVIVMKYDVYFTSISFVYTYFLFWTYVFSHIQGPLAIINLLNLVVYHLGIDATVLVPRYNRDYK